MFKKIFSLLDKWFKISNKIEIENREKEFKVFAAPRIIDEWTRISHCGNYYSYSMFSPVSAFMMCLFKVYGTDNLPIYSISSNIAELDMTNGKLVIDVQTTQPGILIGTGGEHMIKLYEVCKDMFNVKDVEINLKEISTVHTPIENY